MTRLPLACSAPVGGGDVILRGALEPAERDLSAALLMRRPSAVLARDPSCEMRGMRSAAAVESVERILRAASISSLMGASAETCMGGATCASGIGALGSIDTSSDGDSDIITI